jgi:UDP-N-acetylmuramoyl-L-alanyl-D-glutamate--2,6-diaminopimelate ligase
VAYRGFHTDGHAYIPQALERGAAAVVYEDPAWDGRVPVPALRVPNARVALAPLAAAFYGHPGRRMRIVGVTGTDGKTTTTFLTSVALEAGGAVTGLMGTVDFKIAGRMWANDSRQSTPEAPEVQALLRDMAEAGCTYAVIEATSHALSARWNRLAGSAFDIAVFTNVTQEHLDFHGTVEQYRRDKARLFEMLAEFSDAAAPFKQRKIAVVNADDPHHRMFLDAAPVYAERLTYAVHAHADVRAEDVRSTRDGLRFRVTTPWGVADARLRLTGDFNVWNALAALTVACAEGVPLDRCLAALERAPGVRGRMERIEAGQPFTVLVDYAHTPGAFEKLFRIVRPLTEGQVIAVFGSAGERDRAKRPLQGEIAGRFCDLVVVTDEDPRGWRIACRDHRRNRRRRRSGSANGSAKPVCVFRIAPWQFVLHLRMHALAILCCSSARGMRGASSMVQRRFPGMRRRRRDARWRNLGLAHSLRFEQFFLDKMRI